jgi:Ca-activated chloride channel family protein
LNVHRVRHFPLVVTFCATAGVLLLAQSVSMEITSPRDDTYVNGAVRLTAAIAPASAGAQLQQVRWFADGRQVCTAEAPPFTCEWDAGETLGEHQIRAVALLKDGHRLIANARTKGVAVAEAVDVDVVQVTAVVTDEHNRFVSGLTMKDFRVFDDDRPQPLTTFASENIPLELVAAIDVSSSMADALPLVKQSATRFLDALGSTDQVTVLGFNDSIFTLARRSTDRVVRARAVERLGPWGGTALYDVIIRAADLLGRQSGRRAVVVFTDGDDQSSHAPMSSVVQRAEASDATIYMIGQGRAIDSRPLQQLMRQLASLSGGRAFFSDRTSRLESVFEEILEDLRHQYLLAFAPPDGARDGAWHRLRVEVPGHQYTVRARQGYRMMPRTAD